MKITLAVLFLAGLTIYCKCTAVLSLPPSLIARAASLERTQTATQTATDSGGGNGSGGVGGDAARRVADAGTDADDDGGGAGGVAQSQASASELFSNFKNLWHRNFALQKRERFAFEDGIAAASQQQQQPQRQLLHQPLLAIKNNKNDLQQLATITQQHHQQHQLQHQQHDNGNNNFLKMKSSASNSHAHNPTAEQHLMPGDDGDYDDDGDDYAAAAEYDSNEWLAPSSKMTDDIIVSPPTLSSQLATIEEADFDGDDDDEAEVGEYGYGDEEEDDDYDFEPAGITRQLRNFPTIAYDDSSSAAAAAFNDEQTADPMVWSKFLRPLKYWAKQCQTETENNCPQEYYRALIAADRNKQKTNYHTKQVDSATAEMFPDSSESVSPMSETLNNINNDDIMLLLTAEQNLAQFLSWAMAELYPYGRFANVSEDGADYYHPGMFLWKKLNLSGRLEPPLLVEEPHYVIVRREFDQDEDFKRDLHFRDDPFIPPRGRKHNLPDLDALLQRYETFVPNRGRRGDKIKDIFKYDDLFYPNRGKRQSSGRGGVGGDSNIKVNRHHQHQSQLINGEKAAEQLHQHPLAKTLLHIQNVMAKMKRKLHRMQWQRNLANRFDEMSRNSKPTARMSTTYQRPQQRLLNKRLKSMGNILQQQRKQQHATNSNKNLNSRRQWWKRYSSTTMTGNNRPASASAATVRSRTASANRLHALRSMSPMQQVPAAATWQQQQQQDSLPASTEYFAPPRLFQASKFMGQQQPAPSSSSSSLSSLPVRQSLAQQFDPLSWHKLQMLQHQYHLPLLTMRQPALTAAAAVQHQHPVMIRRLQQQLATPQETQLSPYASDANTDNSVANDLKNLFNTDYD